VPRFVEGELAAVWQLDRCAEPPAFVADRAAELDALALELGDRRVDVIAHEIELVMAGVVGRVDGQLGGRESEDEPAVAGVDRRELEDVADECADPRLRPC